MPAPASSPNLSNSPDFVNGTPLRLVDHGQDELYRMVYEMAQAGPEWSRFLSRKEADLWAAQLHGVARAFNKLHALGLTEDKVKEVAWYIAYRYAGFSHQPAAQRRRGQASGAARRARTKERDRQIVALYRLGESQRSLADRFGISRRAVRHVIDRDD